LRHTYGLLGLHSYVRAGFQSRSHISRNMGMDRPQKITFAELRDMGVRGLLIYCSDYKCSHSTAVSADP
jgi:hypothetical protein